MFTEITTVMSERMAFLETLDKKDRLDGTPKMQRLRQIPPETGRFLSIIAANCPPGQLIEIGTSAGYSTMWISLAAKERRMKVKTFELSEYKIRMAMETFKKAEIEDFVELIEGDALVNIRQTENVAFCFLDCEKEMYLHCWEIMSDKIVKGGILVADNAVNHFETIKPMIEKAQNDERFDSVIVPVGKGELICRRK
ncbi:MAG: class I SAM-dependent methyltransferase [Spirochaetales bacterium]|nr:class I SAM-dependent methyltransferase [Spirochaetales bacterium]